MNFILHIISYVYRTDVEALGMCQYLILTQYCQPFKDNVKWKFEHIFLLQCAIFLSQTAYFRGNNIKRICGFIHLDLVDL